MKKIFISENILSGNFESDENDPNVDYGDRLAEILRRELTAFCRESFPNYELEIKITSSGESGYSGDVVILVDDDDDNIAESIKYEYDSICHRIEKNGELYD